MTSIYLFDLNIQQLLWVGLIFIWTGFVRSGLGFGGAALGLPLLLLINDQLLIWLPIIGLHLLFFSTLTLLNRFDNVDWQTLKKAAPFILPGKLAGVFGLLSLPNQWLVIVIYLLTLFYALLWLLNLQIKSTNTWFDKTLLLIGGYFSGTSLTGAPLMVAVFARTTDRSQLRDTLFILWFVLVTIKLLTLSAFGVDLQMLNALLLVPVAAIGHFIGLKTHEKVIGNDLLFKRIIGGVLMLICTLALIDALDG